MTKLETTLIMLEVALEQGGGGMSPTLIMLEVALEQGGGGMSPTPIMLEVAFEPGKSIVLGNGDRGIAIIPNDGGKREKERLANAHRITALWNMAERLGLSTEAVEERMIDKALLKLEEMELMVERGDLLNKAAPDMLEALEEVVAQTENLPVCPFCGAVKTVQSHSTDCLSHEIEAAIQKARG